MPDTKIAIVTGGSRGIGRATKMSSTWACVHLLFT